MTQKITKKHGFDAMKGSLRSPFIASKHLSPRGPSPLELDITIYKARVFKLKIGILTFIIKYLHDDFYETL